ncbi:MAG: hypothetical protein ACT6FB_04805, partial [Methanosarcinaceae archaeon]
NSKTGDITYQHQILGAVIVHPDIREVIPFAPEPIIKQDGETKNDSERNASKRFLEKLRKVHPHLPLIVTEDGLNSNAPHIHELEKHQMHYILGAKKFGWRQNVNCWSSVIIYPKDQNIKYPIFPTQHARARGDLRPGRQ